jgi:DNA transformation protein
LGKKGAKLSAEVEAAADRLCEQLSDLGDITSKKMFGGVGVFANGNMFALVDASGRPHLKVGEANSDFADVRGTERHGRMPYYSVPDTMLADVATLRRWAAMSISAVG